MVLFTYLFAVSSTSAFDWRHTSQFTVYCLAQVIASPYRRRESVAFRQTNTHGITKLEPFFVSRVSEDNIIRKLLWWHAAVQHGPLHATCAQHGEMSPWTLPRSPGHPRPAARAAPAAIITPIQTKTKMCPAPRHLQPAPIPFTTFFMQTS